MATAGDLNHAYRRYHAAVERVDPNGEDGLLGASVEQDAKYAVNTEVRDAAAAILALVHEAGTPTPPPGGTPT